MKKLFLLTVVFALSLTMQAQDDDMYFVPSKESKAQDAKNYGLPRNTYYSGSQRSVDDYNRKSWTMMAPTDSTANDIIDFSAVRGVFLDSAMVDSTNVASGEDYQLTRRMSRFDDYTPSRAYWDGYRDGRYMSPWYYSYNSWYWNDPWYWRSSWYWNDPWYYGYYSPWYYGGYYGPWYYGGYYHPVYAVGYTIGGFHGARSNRPVNHRPKLNGSNYGGHRDRSTRTPSNNDGSRSFGGYRSNSTPINSSFGGSRSSGSFSSGGGSHSSGGGFGGGRSASGGRSYGGKR